MRRLSLVFLLVLVLSLASLLSSKAIKSHRTMRKRGFAEEDVKKPSRKSIAKKSKLSKSKKSIKPSSNDKSTPHTTKKKPSALSSLFSTAKSSVLAEKSAQIEGRKEASHAPPVLADDVRAGNRMLAAALLRRKKAAAALKSVSLSRATRAMGALAMTQSAWQSMDSATHSLKNTLIKRNGSSLESRCRQFIRRKSRNTKEAAKLNEYVNVVERGLQACEILQAVQAPEGEEGENNGEERASLLREAGLREALRFSVSSQGERKIAVTVSLLLPCEETHSTAHSREREEEPPRFAKDEVIVCFTDDTHTLNTHAQSDSLEEDVLLSPSLRAIQGFLSLVTSQRPIRLPLNTLTDDTHTAEEGDSRESNRESDESREKRVFEVQPTLLSLATHALHALSPSLFSLAVQDCTNITANTTVDATHTSRMPTHSHTDTLSETRESPVGGGTVRVKRLRVRLLGHSVGGGVAALAAMLLDGTLSLCEDGTLSSLPAVSVTPTSLTQHTLLSLSSLLTHTSTLPQSNITISLPILGGFPQRVKCVTFGAPPCVSRPVVPLFISSFLCGDDLLTRCKLSAVQGLENRLLEALKSGAGMRGLGWIATPSLLSKVARKNVKSFKERKKDLLGLQLPGHVFYIKSRKLKQGATLQRILRGNWQEEVLWNIHDIVVSKKMLDHHTLAAYIRTLNRC